MWSRCQDAIFCQKKIEGNGLARFVIAHHSESSGNTQKIVEIETKEAALRFYFDNFVDEDYSADAEGFAYFKDDFFDEEKPHGSIIEI